MSIYYKYLLLKNSKKWKTKWILWVSYKIEISLFILEYGMEQEMDMDMMDEYGDQEGMMDMD